MKFADFTNNQPSITLDFRKSQYLDPRVTFTRASFAPPSDPASGSGAAGGFYNMFNVNVPRLTKKGLLIEEARTNEILNSTVFTTISETGMTVADNQATAPDGTNTAGSLFERVSGFKAIFLNEITTGAAGDYAESIFVKGIGLDNVSLRLRSRATANCWHTVTFALTGDGSVTQEQSGSGANFTNISRSIEHAGNGWYRITLGATNPNDSIFPFLLDACNTPTPTLDIANGGFSYGLDTSRGYYVWGMQLETGGPFATSYIPTSGQQVTRAQDLCYIDGDNFTSFFNFGDHTTVAAWDRPDDIGLGWIYRYMNGPFMEQLVESNNTTSANAFGYGNSNLSGGPSGNRKAAVGVSDGDAMLAFSGNLSLRSDRPATSGATDRMILGMADRAGNQLLNGYLRNVSFYPTRLPDKALQALTHNG